MTEAALPKLRGDLRFHEGPPDGSGSRAWIIEDPARNRFFQIGDAARALLARWDAGSPDAVIAAARHTSADIGREDVAAVCDFLVRNGLTQMEPLADYGRYTAQLAAQRKSWLELAIHHYLFFRIPLVRPERFLRRGLPLFEFLFSRGMAIAAGAFSLAGLYLASRQWDVFVSTFYDTLNFEGAIFYGLCLIIVKTAHEAGHAFMAARYGVRVGTMGVAFLVLLPVLYTDVTGAWKLRSRKQRMLISAAGLIVELTVAGLAIFVWGLAPDGPIRSAAYFMAAVSLATSLLVNLNPFMRFDGYYLLSDALGIPNLQQRAFALGRWRLREALFGLKEPNPDVLGPALNAFCIAYAYLTWLYRAAVFAGIALLVYSFFIKAVGIILFIVEIGAFIVWPVCREAAAWWQMRQSILSRRRIWIAASAAGMALTLFFLPMSHSVKIPAILRAAGEARVFPPQPAEITAIHVREGDTVAEGQLLFELRSPRLEQDIAVTRLKIEALTLRLDRRSADADDRSEGLVLEHQLAAEKARLAGLEREAALLQVRSPMAGTAADLLPAVHAHRFVNLKAPLAFIRTSEGAIAEGYAAEEDLSRLNTGTEGEFVPEDSSRRRLPIRLTNIAQAASGAVEIPYLASVHDGGIAVIPAPGGKLRPVSAVYRVTMSAGTLPATRVVRGTVHLQGRGESLAWAAAARVMRVLVREAGF